MNSPWLTVALHLIGERRVRGPGDNPDIVKMFAISGFQNQHDDEAWCAAFVGACLRLSGFANKKSLLAADYATFGNHLDSPEKGCVVVFWPLAPGSSGHVAFFDHLAGNTIYVLGGNQTSPQGNSEVRISGISAAKVRAYRWPVETAPLPDNPGLPTILDIAPEEAPPHIGGQVAGADNNARPAQSGRSAAGEDNFERIQAIIDRLEGGFTQSPDEPGGASNMGISLDTLSRWRDRPVTIAEVRALSMDEAHQIYRALFWDKIGGDRLPAALALMTYNLAVLSGPARGVMFLQRALNAHGATLEEDGVAGPETFAAAAAANYADIWPPGSSRVVEEFAKLEEAFHRASPKAQYLSGWLNRLAQVKQIALSWADEPELGGVVDPGLIADPLRPLPPPDDGLSLGATGPQVKALQQALTDHGYALGAIDGEFGPLTTAALLAFQRDQNLPLTGSADVATWTALGQPGQRPLSRDRVSGKPGDLRDLGSRTISGADKAKLAGLISSILGALGLGNSAVVAAANSQSTGTATDSGQYALSVLNQIEQLLSSSQLKAAGPTQIQPILEKIRDLQSVNFKQALSPDMLQTLEQVKQLVPADVLARNPDLLKFFHQIDALATPAKPVYNTMFDVLGAQFSDPSTLHGITQGLAVVANSFLPGVGGSLVTLGIGLALHYFGNQVINFRTQDYVTAKNLKR
jgi:uncharacterized protein (TIGR02594 family)